MKLIQLSKPRSRFSFMSKNNNHGDLEIALVVAIAKNGVIGASGGMPWRLSSDLKRFKRDTMGKPIIMGRKTWESIGKALPGRLNIVVTRQKSFEADGAEIVNSLEDGVKLANVHSRCNKDIREICVIGGGEMYKRSIDWADRLYVTHVMAEPEGDTYFPEITPDKWKPVFREEFPAGEKDSADTLYVVYEKIT